MFPTALAWLDADGNALPFSDFFGATYQAYYQAPETGTYDFRLGSNEGAQFFVDNVLVIDDSTPHTAYNVSAPPSSLSMPSHLAFSISTCRLHPPLSISSKAKFISSRSSFTKTKVGEVLLC